MGYDWIPHFILIGISLKFYKVDYRFFWFDEMCTIWQTGVNNYYLPINEISNIKAYHDLVDIKKQNCTVASQIKRVSRKINLNPLHYFLLIFWQRVAGDNYMDYRWFNVFLFILTLPCLFLFAKFLFNSGLAGWISVSLFAISPYFHLYTHEARYNILVTFLFIVFNYLFLKALTDNKLKWWIGYSILGILSLYASIISGLVLISHFIYAAIFKKDKIIKYLVYTAVIVLAYLPWLISIFNNLTQINVWHSAFAVKTSWN